MKRILCYCISLLIISLPALNIRASVLLSRSDDCTNRIVNNENYLWILASEGIVRYEKKTGKSEPTVFDLGKVKGTDIVAIAKDKNNHLWIGTEEDEIFEYDGISSKQHRAPQGNVLPFGPLRNSYAFAFDSKNKAWAGGSWFYWEVGNMQETWRIPNALNSYDPGLYTILDMAFDSKDNLWVAVDFPWARFLCHPKGGSECINIYEERLPQGAVYALAIDSKDNIWFTCSDGIHYYNQATKIDTHYTSNSHPDIPKAKYTACEIDEKGNVWFSASNYLLKYDGSKFTSYTCEGFDKARSLLCDGDVIWIYTANDDVLRFENEKFDRVHITSGGTGLAKTESDVPAFAVTSEDGVIRISGRTGISSVAVYDMTARLVLSTKYSGEEKAVTIECSDRLSKGTYLFKVHHTSGEVTIKAVVK